MTSAWSPAVASLWLPHHIVSSFLDLFCVRSLDHVLERSVLHGSFGDAVKYYSTSLDTNKESLCVKSFIYYWDASSACRTDMYKSLNCGKNLTKQIILFCSLLIRFGEVIFAQNEARTKTCLKNSPLINSRCKKTVILVHNKCREIFFRKLLEKCGALLISRGWPTKAQICWLHWGNTNSSITSLFTRSEKMCKYGLYFAFYSNSFWVNKKPVLQFTYRDLKTTINTLSFSSRFILSFSVN